MNKSHTVLLVDDEPNVLHALARNLRGQPYSILTARSGEEAMHVLKTTEVDLVVSDERMPGLQGSDLVAWIAAQMPQVVRIILTGQASIPSAVRSINEGRVYRYLTKPIKALDLAVTIATALEYKDHREEEQIMMEATQRLLYEIDSERQKWENRANLLEEKVTILEGDAASVFSQDD